MQHGKRKTNTGRTNRRTPRKAAAAERAGEEAPGTADASKTERTHETADRDRQGGHSVLGREYHEEDKERLVAFLKGTGDDFLIAMGRKQAPVEEVATSSNFLGEPDVEEQPKPKKRGRKPKAKHEL